MIASRSSCNRTRSSQLVHRSSAGSVLGPSCSFENKSKTGCSISSHVLSNEKKKETGVVGPFLCSFSSSSGLGRAAFTAMPPRSAHAHARCSLLSLAYGGGSRPCAPRRMDADTLRKKPACVLRRDAWLTELRQLEDRESLRPWLHKYGKFNTEYGTEGAVSSK